MKKLTANQIKGLHPAVRAEFLKQRLTDDQARAANRLVRQPYGFKSRIALKAVREKVSDANIAALRGILQAMPPDAPAELLERASFAVLRKGRPLADAVREVEEAAAEFREKRQALESRPRPLPETKKRIAVKKLDRRKAAGAWTTVNKERTSKFRQR
ncbi:MAG: hypothetical protein ABIJ96_08465 [Elusimicrobiota bacterium]